MHFRKHSLRFGIVILVFIGCLLFFIIKLVLIQVFQSEHLAHLAEKQHNYLREIEPVRGSIFDRRGRLFALNTRVYSLYANPKIMSQEDKEKAIEQLPAIIGKDADYIKKQLSKQKYFVWLQRKLDMDVSDHIKSLNIKGLAFVNESKRIYPNGSLAAHVIGFAGIDNTGLEGVELLYDQFLKGKAGQARILRDARQNELMIESDFILPRDGWNLVLTIDETIQYIAEKALAKAMESSHAISATIIVMDPRTGEILALANQPTYDLSDVSNSSAESRTNRAISYVYEPGSIFKIVPAAAALEEDFFKETDVIFCENGEYRIANNILHDHRPHGKLTVREVFEVSSNIGTVKIAQKMGPEMVYKYGKRFRFGKKTGIDLKGEVGGYLKAPKRWSKTSIGAIPIGHEVTATPLQMVSAMAAVANDGIYMQPFVVKYIKDNQGQLIKSFTPKVYDRVISQSTAKRLTDILTGVVDHGTAPRAKIKGVKVAGKTGTAQKVVDGEYSHKKFYASFMGFAPADNPRLAAIVVFDEPYPSYFGGTVAAPVFKEVIENSLKYLQVEIASK